MLTPRENLVALLSGGKPDRLVNQYDAFDFVLFEDPVMLAYEFNRIPGQDVKDGWGTVIRWKAGEHAGMPYITDDNKVLPDITQWKKYVKAPALDVPFDFSKAKEAAAKINRKEKFVTMFMPTGLFERSHFLMGFEDTLMNFVLEPEAMHGLLDYILEYKLAYAKVLIDAVQPDALLLHDDWGAKTRLFMSPETWREFIGPRTAKLHKYIKDRGVLTLFHADSYLANIIEDMAEIDIDIWQGVLPDNNIPDLQKRLDRIKSPMLLMGGIDGGVIDFPDWKEDAVRAETRRACDEYVPGGRFIPCITYGLAESIYPGLYEVISDEINHCSRKLYNR